MGVTRLTNLNIVRDNGNVIGPSTSPSCGLSTSLCCQCIATFCGTESLSLTLGNRCGCNQCDECEQCCCCLCGVCTRVTPGGMYRMNKVYEYRENDTWGPSTCDATEETRFDVCVATCSGSEIDFKGFYYRSSGSALFFAADIGSTGGTWSNWNSHCNNANSQLGSCGWTADGMWTTTGRDYWCSRHCNQSYWNGGSYTFRGFIVNMGPTGGGGTPDKNQQGCYHSFYQYTP